MSKEINFWNFAETVESGLRNNASAPRTWILADRDYTIAGTDEVLLKATSPANGLYPGQSLLQIPGILNQTLPAFEFLNLGELGTLSGDNIARAQIPKGLVVANWSVNLVNNWTWDNVQVRAEPYNTSFPMVTMELGGEGVLCHYTIPGGLPSTHFHEITRFGGSVDGLSGFNPYTFHIPYAQFKTTIFACYESTTTIDPATEEAWWGGSGNVNTRGGLNPLLWLIAEEAKGTDNEYLLMEAVDANAWPAAYFARSRGTYASPQEAAINDPCGRLGWKLYDTNSYEITAAIEVFSASTATNGSAPANMEFKTSASNTAGLTTRLKLTYDGNVIMPTLPTASAGLPTGALWSDLGTLKIAA